MVELTLADAVAVQTQRFTLYRWGKVGRTLVAAGVRLPGLCLTDLEPLYQRVGLGWGYVWFDGAHNAWPLEACLPPAMMPLLYRVGLNPAYGGFIYTAYPCRDDALEAARRAAWLWAGGEPWW